MYFGTLTYEHDTCACHVWDRVVSDCNRFHQRFRRRGVLGNYHYLQGIESHNSNIYPHVHIAFLSHVPFRASGKFVSPAIRQAFKSCWPMGHTDLQQQSSPNAGSAVSYVLKYVSKGGGCNYLWQRVFSAAKMFELPRILTIQLRIKDHSLRLTVYRAESVL